jgi:hypothetical protein
MAASRVAKDAVQLLQLKYLHDGLWKIWLEVFPLYCISFASMTFWRTLIMSPSTPFVTIPSHAVVVKTKNKKTAMVKIKRLMAPPLWLVRTCSLQKYFRKIHET